MAKVRICVDGKEPVWLQTENSESIRNYLQNCGFDDQASETAAEWAIDGRRDSGERCSIDGAELCIERGNVETMDYRSGQWISSPPEMEAFLADIDDVCRKHGLCFRSEGRDPYDMPEFIVQGYNRSTMSMILGALKDYDASDVRKQPMPEMAYQKWEYRSAYIDIGPVALDTRSPGYDGNMVTGAKIRYWQDCLERELNKFGAEGWELVSIHPGLDDGKCEDGDALFKRPLRGNPDGNC